MKFAPWGSKSAQAARKHAGVDSAFLNVGGVFLKDDAEGGMGLRLKY